MGVRKVKGSWWVDFQVRGKRYRLRSPGLFREDAVEYEHALRRRLSQEKNVYLARDPRSKEAEAERQTLSDFSLDWFETYAATRLKPSTFRDYGLRYERHLKPLLGDVALDAITTWAVDRLASKLAERGLHPKSVNNVLGLLRRMLSSAVEWGRLGSMPLVKWVKSPPAGFSFLSPLESDALAKAAAREPWRLMVLTAVHSGLRLGELVALRWEDVDLERGQICVRRSCTKGVETSPKSNRIRFVPFTSELLAALEDASSRPRGSHVFELRGSPVTQAMAWRALQTACARAGIRSVGWHVLRHTFASHLVGENVALSAVQALLGHSDIKMTQRYAHVAPSLLKESVEKIVTARERAQRKACQPAVNQGTNDDRAAGTNAAIPLAQAKTPIADERLCMVEMAGFADGLHDDE